MKLKYFAVINEDEPFKPEIYSAKNKKSFLKFMNKQKFECDSTFDELVVYGVFRYHEVKLVAIEP